MSRCQVTCAAETRFRRVRGPGKKEVSGDFFLRFETELIKAGEAIEKYLKL